MGELYEIIELLGNIQVFLLVICCLGCFFFFNTFNRSIKIFSYYLLFILVINFIAGEMSNQNINNMPLLHILIFGEFIFLTSFFKEIFSIEKQIWLKKYFKIYVGIIGFILILNTLLIEPVIAFNTNGKILTQSITIIYTVFFFFQRATILMKIDKTERSLRLINSALLIYYSGSFFVFLLYNFMQQNKELYTTKVLVINVVLYLLFTIVILIAILMVILHRPKPET